MTDENRRMTNWGLANVALGAAFMVSLLFTTGSKTMAALGLTSIAGVFESWQWNLMLAILTYWMPAILIYVLCRLMRIDKYLHPTPGVHAIILVGNTLLAIYIVLRISGGGGGSSTLLTSILVAYSAGALLAIGFIRLGFTSIQPFEMGQRRTQRFTRSDAGFVAALLLPPAAFVYTLPIEKVITSSNEFSRLCRSAEIKVLEQIVDAKSVAVSVDSFSSMALMERAQTRPIGVFLLNNSLLDYIEKPATKFSGIEGRAKDALNNSTPIRHAPCMLDGVAVLIGSPPCPR